MWTQVPIYPVDIDLGRQRDCEADPIALSCKRVLSIKRAKFHRLAVSRTAIYVYTATKKIECVLHKDSKKEFETFRRLHDQHGRDGVRELPLPMLVVDFPEELWAGG